MLTTERVTKTFDGPDGRITVLDGATLSLAPGARLGLVGPSGCGKSTLAAVLALLLAPDAGFVVLDGGPRSSDTGSLCPGRCAGGFSWSGSHRARPPTRT